MPTNTHLVDSPYRERCSPQSEAFCDERNAQSDCKIGYYRPSIAGHSFMVETAPNQFINYDYRRLVRK